MAGNKFESIVMNVIVDELPAHVARDCALLWPVPIDEETCAIVERKLDEHRLFGHVLAMMNPNDIPRWRAACERMGLKRLGGIILDPDALIVYIPVLADFMGNMDDHFPGYGMCVGDFKTIATAGFRHVLDGRSLDYGYRVQFALEADAAKVDTFIGLFYRLETSHGVEIVYSRRVEKVRATYNLSNGQTRILEGDIAPPVEEWDDVRIETPFDESLLTSARERIVKVLRSSAENLPEREYGPDFACDKCDGLGKIKCGWCDESGISKRSKVGKDGEAKEGKGCKRTVDGVPCVDGYRACACENGLKAETELGFPCSWCPWLATCYPFVRVEIPKRAFGYPRHIVAREDYERSGISFQGPER